MPLLAGVVHRIKLEGVKECGPDPGNGRLLISMDGRLVTPPLINADASRGNARSLHFGIPSKNVTSGELTACIKGLSVKTRARQALCSGAIPSGSTLTVSGGQIVGYT